MSRASSLFTRNFFSFVHWQTEFNSRRRRRRRYALAVIRPGLGEFRVATVKVGELSLPRSTIPRLIARLDKTTRPEGIAPDGIAIDIPDYIGDVRVARGQVTLYRRTQ